MTFLKSRTLKGFIYALRQGDLSRARHYLGKGNRIIFRKLSFLDKNETSAQSPKNARQYLKTANALLENWELAPALAEANRSIGAQYRNGAAHRLNSYILELLDDLPAAQRAAIVAFHSDPMNPESFKLLQKHKLEDEIEIGIANLYEQAEIRKYSNHAVLNGTRCFLQVGLPEEALNFLNHMMEERDFSEQPQVQLLRGQIQQSMRDFQLAYETFASLLDDPQVGQQATLKAGDCLMELGQFDAAEQVITDELKRINPNTARGFNHTLYLIRMMKGQCRDAFRESRFRPFTEAMKLFVKSRYLHYIDDLKACGKVAIVADYGIGDEIRFASIYDDVIAKLPNVTFTCEPRLLGLMQRSFPKAQFLPVKRWREEMIVDNPASRHGIGNRRLTPQLDKKSLDLLERSEAFTSIFDLLAELRPDHASFSGSAAYLAPDPVRVAYWRDTVAQYTQPGRKNIGLSWRSILRVSGRNVHYLKISDLRPLAKLDAVFWIVQSCIEPNEIAALRDVLPSVQIVDDLDFLDDFEEQAAFLSTMDAVIAPCNTTAELAGAVGTPTFLFGRTPGARWRQKPDGTDLWYPSLYNVTSDPVRDSAATVTALVRAMEDRFSDVTEHHPEPTLISVGSNSRDD